MFDAKSLLEQFLGGSAKDGKPGLSPDTLKGLAGGAAAGGLATLLLGSKGGRKMMETAVKVGGTAVLGGLAWRAWQTWQQQQAGNAPVAAPPMKDVTPAPAPTGLLSQAAGGDASLAVLRAMISAAKADGHIDAAEQKTIFAKLDELDLDTEAKAFVMDELRRPLDIEAVVRDATTPERAVELYAASLLAIDPDEPAEQAYLAMLAARLKLEPGLRTAIETEARKVLA